MRRAPSATSGPARRPRAMLRASIASAIAAIALVSALSGGTAAVAVDDPTPPDVNLRVTVVPGTASTVPAAPPPASPTTTRTTVGGSTTVTGSITPPDPTEDVRSIGGILYMSGLGTEYAPSINPLGGELRARFTVLNVSGTTIDSSARFWVTNLFGARLSAADAVEIAGLRPNESRVVEATLSGVGQWTFTTAHVTLTPPASVEGTALEPMTRDAFAFLPPWFLLILTAVGAGSYAVVRILRSETRAAQLVGSTA